MHATSRYLISSLFLILSIFQISALATSNFHTKNSLSRRIVPRQFTDDGTTTTTTTTGGGLTTGDGTTTNAFQITTDTGATITCQEYATVANLSTIGTNSTFRAAFQQASPFGTDKSSGILDNATKMLKDLINDFSINAACGNLTAIAIQEAPNNFTLGIVGPFRVNASGGWKDGRSLAMVIFVAAATTGAAVLL